MLTEKKCQDCQTQNAIFFCTQCELLLCEFCMDEIHSRQVLKPHFKTAQKLDELNLKIPNFIPFEEFKDVKLFLKTKTKIYMATLDNKKLALKKIKEKDEFLDEFNLYQYFRALK